MTLFTWSLAMSNFFKQALFPVLLVLCSSVTAQAAPAVQIGYMPIIADSQAFVIAEGLTQQNPLKNAKLVEFQNGPEIVQALISGQLDVAYVGAGPAMVARAHGAGVRFLAGNEHGATRLLALGNLAPYFKGTNGTGAGAADALARFAQDKGRKPVITTFPIGSVPAAALHYWLRNQIHASPDAIQAVYQGENQVVQALLTGAVDGAAVLDPAVDIVMARRPDARIVVEDQQLFPGQPGAGLLVRESLMKKDPQYVRELVAAHIQATRLLREHPQQAAVAVQKYLGGGRLSTAIVLQSMKNVVYDADPHRMEQDTKTLYDFQSQIGILKKPLVVHDLFDTQIYDQMK